MEMAVYEGQRCEKATGKISFLDSPTMSYQRRTLSACGVRAPIIYMCLFMLMQMHTIKVNYEKQKVVFKRRELCV